MHARKISFDGGANGDLQVIRELGYPKNKGFSHKMEPKGSKMEPKATENDQNGAKREPKGDQNAYKNRSSDKVAKRSPKGAHNLETGAFWEPFSIKNVIKNRCKNQCQKSMEIHEISTKNHPKIDVKIDITCIKKQVFGKG
mgnify:CR=1 FL=1